MIGSLQLGQPILTIAWVSLFLSQPVPTPAVVTAPVLVVGVAMTRRATARPTDGAPDRHRRIRARGGPPVTGCVTGRAQTGTG